MTGWKILTHDYRPPLQGGEPIFDGVTFPYTLPTVEVDTSDAECARGWNFVRDIETGFKIAGLWRTGRPNAVIAVTANKPVERGDKCRAATLKLIRVATDAEIQAALVRFSRPFGEHQQAMADEQWAWWRALQRPYRDRDKVIAGLTAALKARNLNWELKEFPDAWDARDAWDAWDAWAAWDARAARAAWAAWAAWDARDARDAWAARAARDAWDAWAAWAARAARAARAALSVQFAARSGWITHKSDVLTVGIRDAYLNGLGVAVPTNEGELGWSMDRESKETE